LDPQNELALIRKILRNVNSPQTTERFVSSILDGIRDRFDFLACAIIIIDPERGYHRVANAKGWSYEFVKQFHGRSFKGFLAEAATLDEPLLVTPDDPRFQAEGYTFYHPYQSFLAIPMGIQGKRIGVLYVSSADPDAFPEDQQDLFWDLASLCTLILDHGVLGDQVLALSGLDPLTRMYSYKFWHEELHREVERSEKVDYDVSFMQVKLNKFKELNAMHGHIKGDQLLVDVSEIIMDKLCNLDIPCRVGSEWHVLLVGEDREAARGIVEAILSDMDARPQTGDTTVTLSIGLSTYMRGEGEKPLIQRVESALMEARRKGGNSYHYQ
jgi:diguanylate cyclase (GGDEF)-like protein